MQQAQRQDDLVRQAFYNQTVQATVGSGKHARPKYNRPEDIFDFSEMVDSIRQAYEPDYKATSKKINRQSDYSLFYERIKKYRELKASGELDKLRKEGGK